MIVLQLLFIGYYRLPILIYYYIVTQKNLIRKIRVFYVRYTYKYFTVEYGRLYRKYNNNPVIGIICYTKNIIIVVGHRRNTRFELSNYNVIIAD